MEILFLKPLLIIHNPITKDVDSLDEGLKSEQEITFCRFMLIYDHFVRRKTALPSVIVMCYCIREKLREKVREKGIVVSIRYFEDSTH